MAIAIGESLRKVSRFHTVQYDDGQQYCITYPIPDMKESLIGKIYPNVWLNTLGQNVAIVIHVAGVYGRAWGLEKVSRRCEDFQKVYDGLPNKTDADQEGDIGQRFESQKVFLPSEPNSSVSRRCGSSTAVDEETYLMFHAPGRASNCDDFILKCSAQEISLSKIFTI